MLRSHQLFEQERKRIMWDLSHDPKYDQEFVKCPVSGDTYRVDTYTADAEGEDGWEEEPDFEDAFYVPLVYKDDVLVLIDKDEGHTIYNDVPNDVIETIELLAKRDINWWR